MVIPLRSFSLGLRPAIAIFDHSQAPPVYAARTAECTDPACKAWTHRVTNRRRIPVRLRC